VSIGYEIEEITEAAKTGIYTATRWTPLEVSIVTVPADATVGIGRQADAADKPVRIVRAAAVSQPAAPAVTTRSIAMSEQATVAAGQAAAPATTRVEVTEDFTQRISAREAERQRVDAIVSFGKANCIDERAVAGWIQDGTSLDKVGAEILQIALASSRERRTGIIAFGGACLVASILAAFTFVGLQDSQAMSVSASVSQNPF
jgi:hypothetical protein